MLLSKPLDIAWSEIRDRVSGLAEEYRQSWTPDEVYEQCRDGKAFIFQDDRDDTFCIVKLKIDRHDECRVLFVWIACGANGQRERNVGYLKELAHLVNAKRIEFVSPRRGYERTGWKIKETTYTAEV